MSYLNRACLYIKRKKLRTVLLSSILLLTSVLFITTIFLKDRLEQNHMVFKRELEKQQILSLKEGFFEDEESPFSQEYVRSLQSKVTDVALRGQVLEKYEFDKVTPISSPEQFNEDDSMLTLANIENLKRSKVFAQKGLSLVSGRELGEKETDKVLIHEKLALQNHLSIGDTLQLKQKGETYTLKVGGIFKSDRTYQAVQSSGAIENTILTNLSTIKKVNPDYRYAYIVAETNEIAQKSLLMEAISQSGVDDSRYGLQMPTIYHAYQSLLETQLKTVSTAQVISMVVSVSIISLFLLVWVNERKREVGILQAIGISKSDIMLQYWIETILVTLGALIVSISIAYVLSQVLSQHLIQTAIASGLERADKGQVPAVQLLQTLKHIQQLSVTQHISFMTVGKSIIVELCAVSLSVLISSWSLMRLSSKKILSLMS
ncbi:ABC transporter permease [Streptococcus merionis]|uniref:ABC transporter permease n=1 Tax=Streptococcus merionis TaxID=400065 RepID=UPI003511D258